MEIPDGLGFHVLDTLSASIAVLDVDGTVLTTNRAWNDSPHEHDLQPAIEGDDVNYLAVCSESTNGDTADAADGIRDVLEGDREEFSLEYPAQSSESESESGSRSRSESERWFQLTATRTEYEGDLYGIVTHQEITDRKQSEQRAEESDEQLQQFAYAVSHDLQEPLRMITSYLELIDRRYGDELDEDGEEFIEFAVDGAERMRTMIDGLLEYSRIETRGDPFESVDLDTVLEEVRADFRPALEERDGELTVDSLPTVSGDRSQLRQLFQHLLSNAITYTGDEPPRIRVEAARSGADWTVSVSDNGIGIAPDEQGRIFDVFDRLHSREEYEGIGIGLALCERIADRHGGGIDVESEPGAGSTFSVTLPSA